MHILVTGGTGFIGSHTCVALLAAGHETSVIDNLSNSRRDVLDRVEQIAGTRPAFFEGDVRDQALLRQIFAHRPIDAVIHFAGLKAIGESVAQPLRYYDWNIGSTIALCQVMSEAGVKTLVFSSSATVYGDPAALPIREDFLRSTTNPYGASKLMIEDILADLAKADASWKISRLRYFNPVGAHESGLIGETPSGIPNNLMPYVAQVAAGQRDCLSVFGTTTRRPMAPVCATISTSWILPKGMSPRSTICNAKVACRHSIWEPVVAIPSSTWCTLSSRPADERCLTKSSRAAPVISPPATPIRHWRHKPSAGVPNAISTQCVVTPGSGSVKRR